MNSFTSHIHLALLVLAMSATSAFAQLPRDLPSDLGPDVPAIRVRPGYRVTRALPPRVSGLREARFLEFSADGKTLFLSQRREGSILALRDPDENGVFKTVTVFIKDKRTVQGMCWHDNWLYFGQSSEGSVGRARDTNGDGVADDVEVVLPRNSVPAGGGHPYEGLLVTDDSLYVTASDPSNMTEELETDRKKIYIFDLDGKNKRVFCSGVRNNEKMRFRPGTKEIWGFDNGTDNFGKTFGEQTSRNQPITDLNPPEELNLYVQDGFYGHPYLSGNRVPRPEWSTRPDIIELAAKTTPPEWNLHAHWAVLGFTFITKPDQFGAEHVGDIFCASHGSWNSVTPVGACIQRILFDKVTGKPCGSQTIVDCVGADRRWARPVDCAEAPDGSILFTSDDPTQALFRISKSTKPATMPTTSTTNPS